ncbi:MAG: hypothetical protein LBJ23_01450 [Tannerella sp.]|jgi:hypothetical protein|nr:hypothetical protein [Tannerella sp.]
MGETGRNTDEWMSDFRIAMEGNNIGRTFLALQEDGRLAVRYRQRRLEVCLVGNEAGGEVEDFE